MRHGEPYPSLDCPALTSDLNVNLPADDFERERACHICREITWKACFKSDPFHDMWPFPMLRLLLELLADQHEHMAGFGMPGAA